MPPPELADVVVVGLAAARLRRLVARDRIMARPRAFVVTRSWRHAMKVHGPETRKPPVAYLLDCPWCLTVWTAAASAAVWATPARPAVAVLAAAYIGGVCESRIPD